MLSSDSQGQKPFTLQHGNTEPLHTCAVSHQVGKVTLCDYLGADWTYDGVIDEPDRIFNAWVFNMAGSQSNKSLVSINEHLALHQEISFYVNLHRHQANVQKYVFEILAEKYMTFFNFIICIIEEFFY